MTTAAPIYADLNGMPVCIRRDCAEAWVFVAGAWRETNYAEVSWNALELRRATFERRFGNRLPPLPKAAFRS